MSAPRDRPVALGDAFRRCGRITRARSSSYWAAAAFLPRDRRRYVHALYAFARLADDLVDEPGDDPARALGDYRRDFDRAVAGRPVAEPALAAVAAAIEALRLPLSSFDRFFRSMEMDLTVTSYDSWDDLLDYMDGSAAVIGEWMLPILEPAEPAVALGPARDLGLAFQLTNFLRDVADDLDRGRQYIPQDDLRRFGVDLRRCEPTAGFRELMTFEIARCRQLYRSADAGIAMLPARSARCIAIASGLYEGILDEIEHVDGDVFAGRARLSRPRKARVVVRSLLRH